MANSFHLNILFVVSITAFLLLFSGCAVSPKLKEAVLSAPSNPVLHPAVDSDPAQHQGNELANPIAPLAEKNAELPVQEISMTPEDNLHVGRPNSSRNVFFSPLSITLNNEAIQMISGISEKLKADSRSTVLLVGYADHLGSKEYCIALAVRQIGAVETELLKRGVRSTQIQRRAKSCETSARQICATVTCRRASRRVELRLSNEADQLHRTASP